MKRPLFVVLAITGMLSCTNNSAPMAENRQAKLNPVDSATHAYSLKDLLSLDRFGNDQTPSIDHKLVLVAYFSHADCKSCVNRELAHFNRLARWNAKHASFMVAAWNPVYAQFGDTTDLKRMRRVAQLEYPILLESHPGEANLGNRFVIALIDAQQQQIICRYFPEPSIERWSEFEALLIKNWNFHPSADKS